MMILILLLSLLAPVTPFRNKSGSVLAASSGGGITPKLKMIGSMALYGIAGGALLGTASMAFGAPARSIAIGSSLGLYGGLLFGGYVLAMHATRGSRSSYPGPIQENYPGQSSPYDSAPPVDNGYNTSIYDMMMRREESSFYFNDSLGLKSARKSNVVPFYFQLLNFSF